MISSNYIDFTYNNADSVINSNNSISNNSISNLGNSSAVVNSLSEFYQSTLNETRFVTTKNCIYSKKYSYYYNCDTLSLKDNENFIFYIEKYQRKIFTSIYIVFWINSLFQKNQYYEVNFILSEINLNFLDEWSIVALLRSTYSVSDTLPAWNRFLEKSMEHLKSKNKNAEKILLGLYK